MKRAKFVVAVLILLVGLNHADAQQKNRVDIYGGLGTGFGISSEFHIPRYSRNVIGVGQVQYSHRISAKSSLGASVFQMSRPGTFISSSVAENLDYYTLKYAYGFSVIASYDLIKGERSRTSAEAGVKLWEENFDLPNNKYSFINCFPPTAQDYRYHSLSKIRAIGVHMAIRQDYILTKRFDLSVLLSVVPFAMEKKTGRYDYTGKKYLENQATIQATRLSSLMVGISYKW